MRRRRVRSLWVFHLNTGACNGCDIEVLDVLTPYYDAERLGVKLVGSPRHAHALLVTGPLTRQCFRAARRAYEAMPPKPRLVIAIGTCACSGGIFYDSYSIFRVSPRRTREVPRRGGIEEILPVHMYVPGCPPRPEEILYGIARLAGLVEGMISHREYIEGSGRFRLRSSRVIAERIWLDLREELRRIVGYFDRESLLRDFEAMVAKAKASGDEVGTLRDLVSRYCRSVNDPRLAFSMEFLLRRYLELRGVEVGVVS